MDERRARLVLASASPRRRELFGRLDCAHECASAQVDESFETGWTPRQAVDRLARRKARAVYERMRASGAGEPVVLGADTIVVLGDPDDSAARVLGKPEDAADARAMLRELEGRSHTVLTALALLGPGAREQVAVDATEVTFRPLDDREIEAYVRTGEPLDKAGAYGIQGAGRALVEGIRGCFFNVVGFPLGCAAALLGDLCGPGARPCDCSDHPLQQGEPSCGARGA